MLVVAFSSEGFLRMCAESRTGMPDQRSIPDDFAVRVHRDGQAIKIGITGELDLETGPILVAAVATADLENTEPDDDSGQNDNVEAVIDMAELTFIDAAGLRALLAIGSSRPIRLINVAPGARRVLAITGLADLFGVV
jgi:anti-anti-sigma factor